MKPCPILDCDYTIKLRKPCSLFFYRVISWNKLHFPYFCTTFHENNIGARLFDGRASEVRFQGRIRNGWPRSPVTVYHWEEEPRRRVAR